MDRRKAFIISEVLLIAIATLVANGAVFAYDAAFCSYFSIPIEFVSLDLSTQLLVGALVFILGTSLFLIGFARGLPFVFGTSEKIVFGKLMMVLSFSLTAAVLGWALIGHAFSIPYLWAGLIGIRLLYSVLFDVVYYFSNRWLNYAASPTNARTAIVRAFVSMIPLVRNLIPLLRPGLGVSNMIRLYGLRSVLAISSIVALIGFAGLLGLSRASARSEWLTLDIGGRQQLVLAKFGDDIIAEPYDSKTNRLSSEFAIYRVGSEKMFPIHMGWLELKDVRPIIRDDDRHTRTLSGIWKPRWAEFVKTWKALKPGNREPESPRP
jgi:hypothetical protein